MIPIAIHDRLRKLWTLYCHWLQLPPDAAQKEQDYFFARACFFAWLHQHAFPWEFSIAFFGKSKNAYAYACAYLRKSRLSAQQKILLQKAQAFFQQKGPLLSALLEACQAPVSPYLFPLIKRNKPLFKRLRTLSQFYPPSFFENPPAS